MSLKWKGKEAIAYVAQHGGWLRVDGVGMVSLDAAKKADPAKVTGGPRAKPAAKKPKADAKPKDAKKPKAAKPAGETKPKATKPKKPKAAKGSKGKADGIVSELKRLIRKL